MKGRYIVDIETDNLLRKCKRCWIVDIKDKDTGIHHYFLEGDLRWKEMLDGASLIVGHNILGFDLPALEKLFGWKPNKLTAVHDTLVLSQILNYKRFGLRGHALALWGEYLNFPKGDYTDFSAYCEEMLTYCIRDVDLTDKVHDQLLGELQAIAAKEPLIRPYVRAEHAVAKWCAMAELHGWPFDVPRAQALMAVMDIELNEARAKIQPLLGFKTVAKDKAKGVVPAKVPKWTKQGCYDAHTASWFNIDPWSGYEGEERRVEGPYSRVEFVELDLDSVNDVKIFLFRNGWEPTEWNYKMNEATREMEKTSPKITEDSLEVMQGNGKMYCEFLTTKSRHSILKTWLENVDERGMLHGECFTIGTPSMRARHSIIVNVPSADSEWGKEMRELFTCLPGWKLVGCDSSGNQARGLAHYLKSPEFVDLLLNGDIHTYNANVLDKVLKEMGINWDKYLIDNGLKAEDDEPIEKAIAKRKRGNAKRILYAFLFGASGGKLWSYIFGIQNKVQGNKLKAGFLKAVPGFKDLIDKLEAIFGYTKKLGDGYIPGIGGNRIYVDSFHKLLVYLLQACEKATCSAAVMLTMERLEAEGIPYIPCIMMHDEEDFMVPEEFAERAAEIGKQAFKDGPKLFGVEIMDGDAKIGNNWYDIH